MPHPIAIEGFSSDPWRYELGRPGYPEEAIGAILEFVPDAATIVDLGAGTGKLTRLLTHSSERLVVAVDPVPAMTSVARETAPLAHIVTGAAERLPFGKASIDCVTVGQAFHWFDQTDAWSELARVVRPAGAVATIANRRLRDVEWVDRLWALMDEIELEAPWRLDRSNTEAPWLQSFEHPVARHYRQTVAMSEAMLVARIASVSHVAVLDEARRADVEQSVLDIARAAPRPLEIEYEVELSLFRRS